MPDLVQKMVRSPKSRIKRGLQDGRTRALYDAALGRLATKDYEQISIVEIVRGAGCSVGAFYSRFRDKDTFLQMVIAEAFRTLTDNVKRDFDPAQWGNVSRTKIVDGIVRHVASQMSRARLAGVTRAAVKLGMTKPDALEPFLNYRASVADCAVALLVPQLSFEGTARPVRIAVQMVFGIVTDAALHHMRPLRAGSRRMINALSAVMISYLKLSAEKHSGESDDGDGETKESGRQDAEKREALRPDWRAELEKRAENAVMEIVPPAPPSPERSRRQGSIPSPKPIPTEDPKHAKPPEPIKADERDARTEPGRKQRFRIL